MSRRRKKDSGGRAPEWMTTFSDMVTLLLTFFVLLYSFSNLDSSKFDSFLLSFQGRGVLGQESINFETVPAEVTSGEGTQTGELSSAFTFTDNLAENVEMVQNFIEEMGLEAEVTVQAAEHGVAINIKDRILFDSGKADLKPEAKSILDPLAKLFETVNQEIWVEGHTDNRPIKTREYPTNWELSTARSSRVIRYLVENKGLDPRKFVAIGYGEHRPVAPNDSPENMQQNRRVVMIIRMPANGTEVNSDE